MQSRHLNRLLLLISVVALANNSCREDKFAPVKDDGTAPGSIHDVRVSNQAGGAKISYGLPDSENLLYIKAVYSLKQGMVESKASYLTNQIVLEGFGDEQEREVTLYAVSRSEKVSEPVKVSIKPLKAPVFQAFESLKVSETFGGIVVSFENPSASSGSINSNMVIGTLRWDEKLNEWVQIDTYYSGLTKDQFAVRGPESKPYKFGVFIRSLG